MFPVCRYDYDLLNGTSRRPRYYPSNYVPLWTETFHSDPTKRDVQIARVVDNLVLRASFPGGIPTSDFQSGQQWDFPNCWPPLEHMIVMGLERTGLEKARELAFQLAENRVKGAFVNYVTKGHMFEKVQSMRTLT